RRDGIMANFGATHGGLRNRESAGTGPRRNRHNRRQQLVRQSCRHRPNRNRTMADIVAIGEPLFEFNQLPGQTLYRQGFGGDTANFAVAAARAGASVGYLTSLGDEAFGRQFLDLWDREGVDRSAVTLDPEAPTGIYFVSHGPAGHEFTYRRAGSAASRMRFTDAFAGQVAAAKWLHVSGISQAIGPQACDAVFSAIDHAREHGTQISYDLNFRPRLWPKARAAA